MLESFCDNFVPAVRQKKLSVLCFKNLNTTHKAKIGKGGKAGNDQLVIRTMKFVLRY